MTAFAVDTQLFRELGELLVGRDSTALTELVKNAYDADATAVTVAGRHLDDGEKGSISVVDNGVGMTGKEFRSGYLTIAGRGKTDGERRSPRFGRRFTGEKGIGRLAAHKLAHHLDIRSVAAHSRQLHGDSEVRAWIDWDAVERYDRVDRIGQDALSVRARSLAEPRIAGTAIQLSRLRHAWSAKDLSDFVAELDAFQPPRLLVMPLDAHLRAKRLLYDELPVHDARQRGPFALTLEDDFTQSEDLWQRVADAANWVIEIRSKPRTIEIAIAPTRATLEELPDAEPIRLKLDVQAGADQPTFAARILAREGARGTRGTRDFLSQVAGVRVYMEGFRVPPYGEPGNDWLGLDRVYARRSTGLLPGLSALATPTGVEREALHVLPNASYTGAVLLTHRGAPKLEILVNRESFVPSPDLDSIRETLRTALNLLTRIRARLGATEKAVERESAFMSDEHRVRDGLERVSTYARELRVAVASAAPALEDDAEQLSEELKELSQAADRAFTDRSLLRIVASVGTQMAAFVHETEGLVGTAQIVMHSLQQLAKQHPEVERDLLDVSASVDELARRIESQAGYFSEVATVSKRRRRQRLVVSERFEAATQLVQGVTERLGIQIDDEIPDELRTGPMRSAELTVVFSNLLTNAVKAAGKAGHIRIDGERESDQLVLRVENTGASIDFDSGEQWFAPFASTTVEAVDPVLGQGMGLGLPITRSIVEDYGGSIRFVKPSRGFATALEVRLP